MQRNGWIQQMTDNNRQKDRSSNTDNGLEKVMFKHSERMDTVGR